MLTNFLILTLACAGLAMLWRDILIDFPKLKNAIKKHVPFPFAKMLTCGTCFTYWLSLGFVLVFQPLEQLNLSYNTFISWMAFGIVAIIWRFGAVAIQELVHYQTHILNVSHTHDTPQTSQTHVDQQH